MKYILFYGNYSSYYNDAINIRYEVFTKEQKFPANCDIDLIDKYSWHVLAVKDNEPVGTGRIFYSPENSAYKIGRICVLKNYRKKNIGKEILNNLINFVKTKNDSNNIILSSQIKAVEFYKKNFNFTTLGDKYYEDGQLHIKMKLTIKKRGFEKVTYLNEENIILPKRNTKYSAGYDFYLYKDVILEPNIKYLVPTGIKAYMLNDEVLKIYIRSSIAIKKNITTINNTGIIDSDYYNNKDNEGHIFIPLINFGKEKVQLNAGEKIAQGIFVKYLKIDNDNLFSDNIIRKSGFGSTGK